MSAYFAILCKITLLVANLQFFIQWTVAFDPKAFDDSILYKLNWPGVVHSDVFDENGVLISSDKKEKFRCILPESDEKPNDDVGNYKGENPLDLLKPLLKAKRCSYKLGSYWTYEICHGNYVRQYHVERNINNPKGQDYSLGQWDQGAVDKLRKELEETDENGENKYLKQKLPFVKIDNLKLPYLRINMTGGTYCELSKKPRVTYVLYVCYKHGKHEVYSFKEISTCEYETVVLSPSLCAHPKFRPDIASEKNINCYSSLGATPKPRGLYELELEGAKLRQNSMLEGKQKVHVEIIPVDATENEEVDLGRQVPQFNQENPAEDFLEGRECLYGGTSWWKYEFCFGRWVNQFHEEKDGSKTVVHLGVFDEDVHREWLLRNPKKRPLPRAQRKQISHYYANGDVCLETGKPRHTEVRLKCTNPKESGKSTAIILSLQEPKVCEYVLNVEAPMICDLLHRVDKDGLFEERDEDFDLAMEIEESLYTSSERINLPDAASGPPVDGFRLSELLESERKILEKALKTRSNRMRSANEMNLGDESEEERPKSSSSERKDDRATDSQPRTFKPSDEREDRTLNDEL